MPRFQSLMQSAAPPSEKQFQFTNMERSGAGGDAAGGAVSACASHRQSPGEFIFGRNGVVHVGHRVGDTLRLAARRRLPLVHQTR